MEKIVLYWKRKFFIFKRFDASSHNLQVLYDCSGHSVIQTLLNNVSKNSSVTLRLQGFPFVVCQTPEAIFLVICDPSLNEL